MKLANRSFPRRKREADIPLVGRTPLSRRFRTRKLAGVVAIAFALAVAVGAAAWHRFLFLGNVAVVDSGRLIRSAQPKGNLVPLLDRYHPETILNLRGGSWNDPWYAAEVLEAEKRGLAFYDLPLNAKRRPSRKELLLLLDVLDRSRADLGPLQVRRRSHRPGRRSLLPDPPQLASAQAEERLFDLARPHSLVRSRTPP